ncbi:MAG TPA: hypothetical protein VHA52_11865 [Candidatus Babeliaceae bacterium]|nr:hypothetical protein [Candidatus Babeliaceae bacterium]
MIRLQLFLWLRVPVTDFLTGVKWDKWDTATGVLKVSHFTRRKERSMAKTPKNTEQNQHEYTKEELDRLVRFFDVLIEIDRNQKKLYKRLEKEPKGFAMKGEGRNCGLCGRNTWDEEGWFDKWGYKCMNCQDAINKRKIPSSLCGDYDHKKAIPDTDLAMKLDIKVATLRKWIREDKIRGRRIPNGPYMILRKDNPDLRELLAKLAK